MHHDIPHGTEYPPRYWVSPTVLKISPHGTHDILHGTEHPHATQDIPHGNEHPHDAQDIPQWYSWYPPRYCTHIIQGGLFGKVQQKVQIQ